MKLRAGVVIALVGAAFAGSASADTPMTQDQAKALGRAINLTGADLPGWTADRYSQTREGREAEARWLRCAGAVARDRAVAEVPSHNFESPETGPDELSAVSVTSLVTVQRSASLARHDLAALRSKRGVKCERKYGVTVPGEDVKVRITELPEPAPGVWAQRVRLQLSRKYGGEKFYFDLFWFRRGPVEVLLGAASMDAPFSASEEQRLLTLLFTRAQQQIP